MHGIKQERDGEKDPTPKEAAVARDVVHGVVKREEDKPQMSTKWSPELKKGGGSTKRSRSHEIRSSERKDYGKRSRSWIKVKEGNWKGVLAHPAGLDVEMKILGRLERVQLISNLHQGLQ